MGVSQLVARFAPTAVDEYPHKAAMAVMQQQRII